ncbi:hypothetical protein OU787_02760 [Kitasatospora sp. YST-16]|uniref:recombination directionality factor n=1 Tax=Kitasatospora sp. YST-16 TaxID=2998080 RepID=UPI0022850721|nr:hypothetical protein [Kitasatospora sp. YST-16]WAL70512.1 hypothetical protein OU787_02760 [Kitasatospora sp. YST-16]WNW36552.1 hypothetical protein RKE32_02755 [Streptomyces sp. Li-HN-5-13]
MATYRCVKSGLPVAAEQISVMAEGGWCFITGSRESAVAVASALGGRLDEADPRGSSPASMVRTGAHSLSITMHGAESISFRMVHRGVRGSGKVRADHRNCHRPAALEVKQCGRGTGLAEQRSAARSGHGAKPEIKIAFRLTEAPSLGVFEFATSSWTLAGMLEPVLRAFSGGRASLRCELRIESRGFETSDGVQVTYHEPVLVLG